MLTRICITRHQVVIYLIFKKNTDNKQQQNNHYYYLNATPQVCADLLLSPLKSNRQHATKESDKKQCTRMYVLYVLHAHSRQAGATDEWEETRYHTQ